MDIDVGNFFGLADLLGINGILKWVTNRPDINKYSANRKDADIYIHPSLPDYDITRFGNKNSARMIQAGYSAAMEHWKELQRLAAEE